MEEKSLSAFLLFFLSVATVLSFSALHVPNQPLVAPLPQNYPIDGGPWTA